jgi:putative transposase
MGRMKRVAAGEVVYHVLNRANARLRFFFEDGDYEAFEKILEQAVERSNMRLLAYALMPNHWHMVVWPREDGELSRFVGWLTLTHTQRWHAFRRNAGTGHLYKGRFKSLPVQEDEHLRILCRYVERNPLTANLVEKVEDWRWSSLWRRISGSADQRQLLSDWPIERGANWLRHVQTPITSKEVAAIVECIDRGRPFGDLTWQQRTAARMGLQSTLRPIGRPKIQGKAEKQVKKGV